MNLHPETRVIRLQRLTDVPTTVRTALRLAAGVAVWYVERLRLVDEQPMTVERLYLQTSLLPELTLTQASASLFKQIENEQTIGYASQELEAVSLTEPMAQLLEVDPGAPAFLAHTVTFSVDGYPILYDDSYYRSDKYTFHNILYRHH